MWQYAKSGALVVLITVLIWLAADQNVSEEQSFLVPVRLMTDSPDHYAAFVDPTRQVTFNVTVVGRRRHIREFNDFVASKSLFEAVVDRTKPASPRPQTLAGTEVLGWVKALGDSRVSIRSVDPPSALAMIDVYETVPNVRVEPAYGDLKVSAEVTPSKVSIKLPRFAAVRLRPDPVAVAEAQQRIRAAMKPDGAFQVRVPLNFDSLRDADPDLPITALPAGEVTIVGRIEALTQTKRKGPVQITFSIPQQVQDEYRIVAEPGTNFRPDIDVNGPKDQIDQLDPRDIRAFIEVMAADMEHPRTKIRRPVQFILPSGFALADGTVPVEVVFELEPRSLSPPAEK